MNKTTTVTVIENNVQTYSDTQTSKTLSKAEEFVNEVIADFMAEGRITGGVVGDWTNTTLYLGDTNNYVTIVTK